MLRKKYFYGIDGEITRILPTDHAEIQFCVDGAQEHALLKKNRFYYNGRPLPDSAQLSRYVRVSTKVKFSCHVLNNFEEDPIDGNSRCPFYGWYAIMCWVNDGGSPNNRVSVIMGLYSVACCVESVGNRHGVLTTVDDELRIEFLASKFYVQAKRLPSSKMLSAVLRKDDRVFCDAVPCIKPDSRAGCEWFATCVFQGKRPRLAQPYDTANDFTANYLVWTDRTLLHKDDAAIDGGGANDDRSDGCALQSQNQSNLKSQLLKVINLSEDENFENSPGMPSNGSYVSLSLLSQHTSNPRTLFTSGYGFVLDVVDDEFAILLGCFKLNVFQTILFHRRNAFVFKSSLASSKLTEILVEGDYLRFIAVGAPPNFVTSWIAVQVAIAEFSPDVDDSSGE